MVILDSDDLPALAHRAAEARLDNMGQACNSPKRMIVLQDIYPDFVTDPLCQAGCESVGDR